MSAPAVIEPIMQKDASDCVLAALAMVAALPYKDVSRKALELWPTPHTTGLSCRDAQRLLKALLGYQWVSVAPKEANLEEETGVLFVKLTNGYHAVALFEGVVINPADGLIWNLPTYLATKKGHPIRFLRP